MDSSTLVQPILVLPDRPRNQIIADAALAAVQARVDTPDAETWREWDEGPHTKSVREVKTEDRLAALVAELGLSRIGDAASCTPLTYGQMPKKMSRTQVTGWDKKVGPDTAFRHFGTLGIIWLNETLQMSTGKAAAQAAHALSYWYATHPFAPSEHTVAVKWTDRIAERDTDVQVRDNGLTEVPAGSFTAAFTAA